MRKLIGIFAVTFGLTTLILSFAMSGCGHYHKRDVITNVTRVDSSTNATIPSNTVIILHQPVQYDQTALLEEILRQLREFNDTEQEITVTVEVDNNINVVTSVDVDVEGDTITIRPDETKTCPQLYHWLKKVKGKKCDKTKCGQKPKPCDNEED